jgi:hypothetical protein
MDVRRDAGWASANEGVADMPAKTLTLRRCHGSTRFGIEPHDAPSEDFPTQPSQKDGLGRMCKTHWNAYTAGLARDAKAADGGVATEVAPTKSDRPAAKGARTAAGNSAKPAMKPQPIRTKPTRGRKTDGEQIVEAVDAALARETADVEEASIA